MKISLAFGSGSQLNGLSAKRLQRSEIRELTNDSPHRDVLPNRVASEPNGGLKIMMLLANSFLCPGNESGSHITDNPTCCECGNSNIFSLAKILDRVEVVEQIAGEVAYDGICSDLPAIQRMFEN